MESEEGWTEVTVSGPKRDFSTAEEVAILFRVPVAVVWELVEQGKLPKPINVTANKVVFTQQQVAYLMLAIKLGKLPADMFEKKKEEMEAKEKAEASRFVYFVLAGEFVKVGVADDPRKRIVELQCANPMVLDLIHCETGGQKHEKRLHRQFSKHRVRSNGEWFRYAEEIRDYIASRTSFAVLNFDGTPEGVGTDAMDNGNDTDSREAIPNAD